MRGAIVSQMNAKTNTSRQAPSTGTISRSIAAVPVIASDPPIQTGVSIQ